MAAPSASDLASPGVGPDAARLVAAPRPGDNAAPLSVGELSAQLKRAVEQGFGHVRVRGEISGFKRAASGHLYFGLKDADARIDGIIWKGNAARLPFAPEDGLDVIATGKLTTYPGRSSYQIVIDALELAGEGALLALLEKTKARLAAEGLFAPERKRSIPRLPRTIGVVTSPTGAVIRDILHRLSDRFPVRVLVWPVLVQGEAAAGQIAAAIGGFDAMPADGATPRPDLVIVARGGGSIEDLWAFNEEVVVRAAADCTIPLISAVGHETDTTLIDYAADRRAPTPTAAAEMAVPVRAELIATIDAIAGRASAAWSRRRAQLMERLGLIAERLPALDRLLSPQRQRLDDMADRIPRALGWRLERARADLAQRTGQLRPALLSQRLDRERQRVSALHRVLRSLDPRALLARGYALVTDRDGRVVASVALARAAQAVQLSFADGAVEAQIGGQLARPPRKPPAAAPGQQGGLFD
jgi:exodeoxyribonuclease VII large subunit